ncbi:MAG: hypothetical protein ACHP93_06300 [Solirubrobacterales bacterium]
MSASRRTVLVVVVAVLGIALAAAITWGTSQLVRQRIGLASEPLTAGRRLLPAAAGTSAPANAPSAPPASTTSTSRLTQSSPAQSRATSPSPAPPTNTTGGAPSRSAEPATPPEPATPVAPRSGREGDSSSHRDD